MERNCKLKLIRKDTISVPVPNYDFSMEEFSPDELEAADALRMLAHQSRSLYHSLPLSWVSRGRRSALHYFRSSPDPAPPPSPRSSPPVTAAANLNIKNQVVGNSNSSSPTSPFSLSPSETEEKVPTPPSSSKKTDSLVKKKIKKHNKLCELRATVSNLSKQQEELREAVNKVRNYYDEQKQLTVDLEKFKESQIKLLLQTKPVDANLEVTRSNQTQHMEPTAVVAPTQCNPQEEEERRSVLPPPSMCGQSQAFNDDRTAMEVEKEKSECRLGPKLVQTEAEAEAEGVVSGMGRHHKPLDLDLNVTPEEAFVFHSSFNYRSRNNAVACAEARRRRCEINRVKKAMATSSSLKPRCH